MRQLTTSAARLRILVLLAAAALPAPVAAAGEHPGRRDELVGVVARVKASVVNIHSERTVVAGRDDPFRPSPVQPQRVNGMGTGIVLDPRGYVVTNYHVVDEVQSLRVHLADGTNCPARVLATDKEADLAIVKIDPPRPLSVAALGTADDLMLAETVIAIGNAYGYEHTVTVGTVSAMKRDVTLNKEVAYKSLIQTQTPINPGNSGGPLFNKLGEVVGVNVAIRAGAQNIAFAIPVDTVIARAAELLSVRKRLGLRHGLTVADHHARDADDAPLRRWVSIERVEPGSPAAEAGLKPGDVLETVGDVDVRTSIDLERALFDRPVKGVPVKVKRSAETVDATLVLQPVPSAGHATPAAEVVWRRVGVRVQPVGAESVTGIDRQLRGGLMVLDVAASSPAAKAGLQRGDVLIGLHQWESIDLSNVLYVLNHKDLATFSPFKVYFARGGRVRETTLTAAD
ncbi:MAG TPA: trypsin-like peptidase domain-containing protein [Fimbriiglobus sp.]|nr:trypsin-like peptidase domain-containing protein [Fimbriiglobus sp.]